MNSKHQSKQRIIEQQKTIATLERSNLTLVEQRDKLKAKFDNAQAEIERLKAEIKSLQEPFSPFWIGEQMAKDDDKIGKLQNDF